MNFKKLCFIISIIIVSSLPFTHIFANEQVNYDPCYRSYIDYNNLEFDSENTWLYKISSASGSEIVLNEDNLNRTFFMYDGEFIFEEDIIIDNDCALISAEKLSRYLNVNIEIKDDTVRIYKNYVELKFTDGSNEVHTDNVVEITPACSKIVDGIFYIPLRYTSYNFGFVITYLEKGVGPFNNPVIGITNREISFFKSEAVEIVIQKVAAAYDAYLKNSNQNNTIVQRAVVLNKIKNAKYIGELSNYYVIESVHILLVDTCTGEIFVKYGEGNGRHGSYSEMIKKLDADELFK